MQTNFLFAFIIYFSTSWLAVECLYLIQSFIPSLDCLYFTTLLIIGMLFHSHSMKKNITKSNLILESSKEEIERLRKEVIFLRNVLANVHNSEIQREIRKQAVECMLSSRSSRSI